MTRTIQPGMHGTISGYTYGCRCEECSAARREYQRAWREQRRTNGHAPAGQRRCADCGEVKVGWHATACMGRLRSCEYCSTQFINTRKGQKRSARFCSHTCAMRSRANQIPLEEIRERRRQLEKLGGGLTDKARRALLAAWVAEGRLCAYCAAPCECVDHVVALIRGGSSKIENLAPACLACNSAKGSLLLSEWVRAAPAG